MKLTKKAYVAIAILLGSVIGFLYYKFGDSLFTLAAAESKTLSKIDVSNDQVDVKITSPKVDLPSGGSPSVTGTKIQISAYPGGAQGGILSAMGGSSTQAGSLMEKYGVNLSMKNTPMWDDIKKDLVTAIAEFNDGKPLTGSPAVFLMGDGAPYFAAIIQRYVDETYGKGKYHIKIVSKMGQSLGEDKLIAPVEWRFNPQAAKGKVVYTVVGDGDWVVVVNWAFANNIPVNPNPNTYDPNAINFFHDADYIVAAQKFVATRQSGKPVKMKLIENGKISSKEIDVPAESFACATWFPGDKVIADAKIPGLSVIASTKEFKNQMPCALITFDEWAKANRSTVKNVIKASLEAGNQIKQYPEWKRYAATQLAAFNNMADVSADDWYKNFNGYTVEYNGTKLDIGGSSVSNLADNEVYFGLKQGETDRYRIVYDAIGRYLTELNPSNFASDGNKVIPYDEIMDFSYLKDIITEAKATGYDAGTTTTTDYSETATKTIAKGEFKIEFRVGSSEILPISKGILKNVAGVIGQSESKVELVGHTDNTGDPAKNTDLSKARALAVRNYLVSVGVKPEQFQLVDGHGQEEPVTDNNTEAGRAKNRRVEISLKQ